MNEKCMYSKFYTKYCIKISYIVVLLFDILHAQH